VLPKHNYIWRPSYLNKVLFIWRFHGASLIACMYAVTPHPNEDGPGNVFTFIMTGSQVHTAD